MTEQNSGSPAGTPEAMQDLLAREARHSSLLWNPAISFVSGEGCHVMDAAGRTYIDCMAGIAVASLGHAHPRLVRAISEQAGKLIICSQSHGNDVRTEFLEALFSFVKPPLVRAFMASSGSEINEAALKWARAATGRQRFVAARRGFSGRTLGVLSLTWEPKYRQPFSPLLAATDFVDYNDIAALEEAVTGETAAVFLEPIQGEGGINEGTREYLETARRLATDNGALLIFDEIQTGVGRTGTFLASEASGVVPDMVTLAKGLGGGVPVAALLMTDEVARAMPPGGHGTTFGGNALASAAAFAVLEEIREGGLLEHVRETGAYFREKLLGLDPERIVTVRGRGLLLGLELSGPAAPVMAALLERGVLTINAGENVIRFVPPLTFTKELADEVTERLAEALAATAPA